MDKLNNYPAGVNDSHPHFNPPTCPNCGEVAEPGENCPDCGKYFPTKEDYEDMIADMKYDQMMEEGRDSDRY